MTSPWPARRGPDGILVPKISSVEDLETIADRLTDISADASIRVWAMIETRAAPVLHAEELAAASRDFRAAAGRVSYSARNDLSRETGIRMRPGRAGDDPDDHALHSRHPPARPRDSRRSL